VLWEIGEIGRVERSGRTFQVGTGGGWGFFSVWWGWKKGLNFRGGKKGTCVHFEEKGNAGPRD